MPDCRNDEFSDWPQSLLAIGTFGNKQIEEVAQVQDASEDGQSMQDAIKFTEEEVDRIQKEFAMILASKDQAETHDPRDDDQVTSHKNVDESINEKHRDQMLNKKMVISKGKDSLGKKASTLKPRSVASLLKLLIRKWLCLCCSGSKELFPSIKNGKGTLTFSCKFVVNYTFLTLE